MPDTGCAESPTCLACQLPVCVLDIRPVYWDRVERIHDLHTEGYSIREIARIERASMRTVWRILREGTNE